MRRSWELPESAATPEQVYLKRRELLAGFAAAGLTSCGLSYQPPTEARARPRCGEEEYGVPPDRNPRFTVPERCLTPLDTASGVNNFYEFTTDKGQVRNVVPPFITEPWTVEVGGLVRHPQTLDLDALASRFQAEERIYRFRCIEAWAMTVPWSGFAFTQLAALVEPLPQARFVRFVTALAPEAMPGVKANPKDPWPYQEGLRLDEAMNELTFLVTGLYGKPLPKQNGAPLRLAVPWKYGFKSIKSIVRIDFVEAQPPSFWRTVWPEAYSFLANVDPAVPHPKWPQLNERLLESGLLVPTQKFNGYGEFVADLYR